MTAGPYRTSARPLPEKVRCCGKCDQLVGGCLQGLVFKHTWGMNNLLAGISERAPQGTRPLVSDDGGVTWRDEGEA